MGLYFSMPLIDWASIRIGLLLEPLRYVLIVFLKLHDLWEILNSSEKEQNYSNKKLRVD